MSVSSILRIAVTGASGFVGSALVNALRLRGHAVDPWSRSTGFDLESYGDASALAAWRDRLSDIDVVVHAAARVHRLDEQYQDPGVYCRQNAAASAALAHASKDAGVSRFVFLSSAKVYGEGDANRYAESMLLRPVGAYAESKRDAEKMLVEIASQQDLDCVILRPPLVYGRGVGGNFAQLARLACKRWPLPLAAIDNRRDMIALDNLVEILAICCEDSRARSGIFNVADARPYTLSDIVSAIRKVHGRSPGQWAMPAGWLRFLIATLRGIDDAQRLLGEFRLDTSNVQETLGWTPRLELMEVVGKMYVGEAE